MKDPLWMEGNDLDDELEDKDDDFEDDPDLLHDGFYDD